MKKLVLVAVMFAAHNALAVDAMPTFLFETTVKTFGTAKSEKPQTCEDFSGEWTVTCKIVGNETVEVPPQQLSLVQNGCDEMVANGEAGRIGEMKTKKTIVEQNGQQIEVGTVSISNWNNEGSAILTDAAGLINMQTSIENFSLSSNLHKVDADSLESNIHITYKTLPEITITCSYNRNSVR